MHFGFQGGGLGPTEGEWLSEPLRKFHLILDLRVAYKVVGQRCLIIRFILGHLLSDAFGTFWSLFGRHMVTLLPKSFCRTPFTAGRMADEQNR